MQPNTCITSGHTQQQEVPQSKLWAQAKLIRTEYRTMVGEDIWLQQQEETVIFLLEKSKQHIQPSFSKFEPLFDFKIDIYSLYNMVAQVLKSWTCY